MPNTQGRAKSQAPNGSLINIPVFLHGEIIALALGGALAEDDVVKHLNLEQLAGAHEVAGDADVRLGRRRVAAGMIVNQHHRRGIRRHGMPKHITRVTIAASSVPLVR